MASQDGAVTKARAFDWRVPSAAALAVLIWAGNFPVMKIVVASVDYFLVGALRTVLVGLPMWLMVAYFRPALPRSRAGWAFLLAGAAGNYVAFPVLASLGLTSTTAARAGFIFASAPALTACLGALVMGDRMTPRRGAGIALSLVGVAVLIGPHLSPQRGVGAWQGDLLVFLATVGSAVSYVAGAYLGRRIGAWTVVAYSLALASAPLSGAMLLSWRNELQSISLGAWVGLIYLSVFGTLVANALWIWALSQGSIVSLGSFQFLQPVFTVAIAAVFLGERLSWTAVAGGGSSSSPSVSCRRELHLPRFGMREWLTGRRGTDAPAQTTSGCCGRAALRGRPSRGGRVLAGEPAALIDQIAEPVVAAELAADASP